MSDNTTPAPVTDGHEPAPDETQGLPAVDEITTPDGVGGVTIEVTITCDIE